MPILRNNAFLFVPEAQAIPLDPAELESLPTFTTTTAPRNHITWSATPAPSSEMLELLLQMADEVEGTQNNTSAAAQAFAAHRDRTLREALMYGTAYVTSRNLSVSIFDSPSGHTLYEETRKKLPTTNQEKAKLLKSSLKTLSPYLNTLKRKQRLEALKHSFTRLCHTLRTLIPTSAPTPEPPTSQENPTSPPSPKIP